MNKLAIIIPYFKLDFFEETIASLAGQTDRRFTLYIGNDASPDDPLPMIDKYFRTTDYRYFDYKENVGGQDLPKQWQRILDNVTEEWFEILGDDDVLSPNFVEEFYKCQGQLAQMDIVKCKPILYTPQDQKQQDLYKGLATGSYNALEFMISKLGGNINCSLSEHIFRRSAFLKHGFVSYPLGWHTDDMVFLQVSDFGSFFYNADAVVYIRKYEGSISGSDKNLQKKNEASALFFDELTTELLRQKKPLTIRLRFLQSLKQYKANLGMKKIQQLYYRHGFQGQFYFWVYQAKLALKRFLPSRIVRRIQVDGKK